ncbi:MAG: hypothetical protein Q7U55_04790, partial [Deltaproteobacteria bacterium]|nr:hypothetical protein [Deltaproteobacteria bacterium]
RRSTAIKAKIKIPLNRSISNPPFSQTIRTCLSSIRLLKKSFYSGCPKMPRYEAPEILRSEAYLDVRRNDEG